MHIEYLRLFYEVASVRSISKVANYSHISQPALSQQIQRLEDSLGYKLLVRSNKGVELTEAGRIVEKYCKSLIRSYDNMTEDLDAINKSDISIRIESCPTMATYALPCTLYLIKEEFPQYNYNLTSNLSDIVEQNVLNDVCDVGFIQGIPNDEELVRVKVGTDRLVLISSYDYNIEEEISLKELMKYPLVMIQEKFKYRKQINEYFKESGYNMDDYKVLFNLDSTESVKSSVAKGYGLSFVPYIAVKKELYIKQLKEIKVQDFEMCYEIYIIYKKDKNMNKSTKEFIQFLKRIGETSFC